MTTSLSIAASLVCITCLVYMGLRHRVDKVQSKVFIVLALSLCLTAVADIVSEGCSPLAMTNDAAAWGVRIADYVYFPLHMLAGPLFCMYVQAVCIASVHYSKWMRRLFLVPFAICEAVALANPFLHWLYYYTPDMVFVRNTGMYVLYVVGFFYLVMGMVSLMRHWHAVTRTKRRAMTYFFVMTCAGIAIQLVWPTIRAELFAESLATLGVMMFVEDEDELMDSETGVYSRNAFITDLELFINPRNTIYVISVRVTNADAFTRIAGSTHARQYMVGAVAAHVKSIVPWYRIYRTAPAQYVLVDPGLDEKGALDVADRIAERFTRSWDYRDVNIDLHAVVSIARIPDDVNTASDVLYFIGAPAPPHNKKKVLFGDDLDYLMRRAEVERAVQRGLVEGNYEVYYQPIFDANGEVRSAEALMRLHDTMLGDIPPFEFIEVAERIGFIEGIGYLALREVCAFLASGVPQKLGLTRINVNLSVIQCMQADLPVRVKEIIGEYDIDPHLIGFEITESVASGNYEFLNRAMNALKADGHNFSMDDYGTGYSNIHSFLSLDFDIVKIDKSVLWDAERNDQGMIILQNCVNMLRGAGCAILVEGVETESQVRLLGELNVDYQQGFHYARPMSKDDLVSFLS